MSIKNKLNKAENYQFFNIKIKVFVIIKLVKKRLVFRKVRKPCTENHITKSSLKNMFAITILGNNYIILLIKLILVKFMSINCPN